MDDIHIKNYTKLNHELYQTELKFLTLTSSKSHMMSELTMML
jgi:hypothetical protein